MAIREFRLKPFVDASCRREPDFESKSPSITCLCRKEFFAPRLRVGSKVIYITKKGRYFNSLTSHWRLVAVLEVIKTFQSHKEAATWYREKGEHLPNNCMVYGNPPVPLEKTDRFHTDLRHWDAIYRMRAKNFGIFLVCKKILCDLERPPAITEQMMRDIFGRIPGTRMPPEITEEEMNKLMQVATNSKNGR